MPAPVPPDRITIQNLRAITRVGVPDSERGEPQEISVSLRLLPAFPLADLGDDIARTVDYYQVCQEVLKLAAGGERRLLETLAEDLAAMLLARFDLAEVGVELKKFVLPETEYVAVELVRRRDG